MVTKDLAKRFGITAIERGFITPEDVVQVMSIQKTERTNNGRHRYIGKILLDRGLISISQIDEVLESMGKGPALELE
jgi:phosphoglucomutase